MNSIVPCNAHNIERFLNLNWQSLLYQSSDIRINVLSSLSKMFTELLNCKTEKCGCSTR